MIPYARKPSRAAPVRSAAIPQNRLRLPPAAAAPMKKNSLHPIPSSQNNSTILKLSTATVSETRVPTRKTIGSVSVPPPPPPRPVALRPTAAAPPQPPAPLPEPVPECHTRQSKEYFLIVVAICKNEGHIMEEWLSHYRKEGVNHFVIIDNGSSATDMGKHICTVAEDVTLIEDDTKHAQVKLYNQCVEPFKARTEWILVVDFDEFLFARRDGSTIASVLRDCPDNVGQIVIPWLMFGSSGHVQQPASVIESFTCRQRYSNEDHSRILKMPCKSIVRSKALQTLKIHIHQIGAKYVSVDECFETNPGEHPSEPKSARGRLQLNHYAIQSLNFFTEVKAKRGSASASHNDNIRTIEYFRAYDYNDIVDTTLVAKKYT